MTTATTAHFPTAGTELEGDPFVLNGVVRSHEIRDWNEIYS